jgi:hypothetical protein
VAATRKRQPTDRRRRRRGSATLRKLPRSSGWRSRRAHRAS